MHRPWQLGAATLLLLTAAGAARAQDAAPDPKAIALTAELFSAIRRNDAAATRAALDHGADINRRNWINASPTDWAGMLGRTDLAQLLIARGADLKVSMNGTPLATAILGRQEKIARALLAAGADVEARRPDGATTLMLASAYMPALVPDLKPTAAEVARQDIDGATALIYAARLGQTAAVTRLLAAGAKVDQPDKHGRTPLMYAAMNGFPAAVDALLRGGARAAAADRERSTALHLAARYSGDPAVARRLLAAGAPVGGKDAFGKTPLALAQARRYDGLAAALRGAGARPEAAVGTPPVRTAVQKSVVAMQKGMTRFLAQSQCASCHHQGLGLAVLGQASLKGFAVQAGLLQNNLKRIADDGAAGAPLLQAALADPAKADIVPFAEMEEFSIGASYFFWALDSNRVPGGDPGLGGLAQYVANQQQTAGNWRFTLHRGPMQESFQTVTALEVLGMRRFLSASASAETLRKARAYFATGPTRTAEDRAARLLGLRWSGGDAAAIRTATAQVVAAQNRDGGWGKVPGATSDPMTTGIALYSLRAGGALPVQSAAVRRASDYLLRRQDENGAWYVNKTVAPFNYFFDTGFPGGESQYVSFAATGWATLALMEVAAPAHTASR